jgi:predicted XRE-type DNA-binding protein
MGQTHKEWLASLPPERQAKIKRRAAELIAEEMTLRDVRKAMALTQERMAELLQIKQANVSRLEKRTDMHLSTLREYVAAMGGHLRLMAEFPDRPPVTLRCLADVTPSKAPQRRATAKTAKATRRKASGTAAPSSRASRRR